MARVKLSKEQQLAVIVAQEKKLAERKAKILAKTADLNADSAGMAALLTTVQTVADDNKVAIADVIKAVAKLKRTGLKIEKATRKPKDPNAPKRTRGPNKPKQA